MSTIKNALLMVLAIGMVISPDILNPQSSAAASVVPKATLQIRVPFHRQQHALSCEAAGLRMLLLERGIDTPENELIDHLHFGPMRASDPQKVFVGNIKGRQMTTGYGVYWDPIVEAASNYVSAEAFSGKDTHYLIDRLHDHHPVLIWTTIAPHPRRISWRADGKSIEAVSGEHVWVVTGYAGPRRAPTHIFVLDPIYGRRVYRTADFLARTRWFHNSGMFLK